MATSDTSVLVIGASGLTGSFLVPMLLREGFRVRCLSRKRQKAEAYLPAKEVTLIDGNVNDPTALRAALEGAHLVVHIPNMLSVNHRQTLELCLAAGVRRLVFFSTTAIFTTIPSGHRRRRLEAEREIFAVPLETVVVRPTMIYGTARDRNMSRLIRYLARYPVLPVVGDGSALQQPVYAADVASAVLQALTRPGAAGRTYNLAGKEPLPFNQVVATIARVLGRRVRILHLPARPIIRTVAWFEDWFRWFPVLAEQLVRLNEDKAVDYSDATRDLGYQPLGFCEGITREVEEMRRTAAL